jgi:uncharacterized membrane protein
VGESVIGVKRQGMRSFVLVSIEDAWQLVTPVDELEDGLLAVFIPGVPLAGSGSLYFMAPDRVRRLSTSTKSALLTLRRMGVGSRDLLKGEMLSIDPAGGEVQRQWRSSERADLHVDLESTLYGRLRYFDSRCGSLCRQCGSPR